MTQCQKGFLQMTTTVHAINTPVATVIPTTLTWSALSRNQKVKFIDAIRDDKNGFPLIGKLNEFVERYIESLYEDDTEFFAEESVRQLSQEFGIEASTYFRHGHQQGDGFCFDDVKSVDLFHFFTRINLLDINSKLNDLNKAAFERFLDNITLSFERKNHHYDHENSVIAYCMNHNDFEDEEQDENLAEFLQWLHETFTDEQIEDSVNEWKREYCLEKFAEFRNIIDGITDNEDSLFEVYDEAIECFVSDIDATFDVSSFDRIVFNITETRSAIVKI